MKLKAIIVLILAIFVVSHATYTSCADVATKVGAFDGWYLICPPGWPTNYWVYCCFFGAPFGTGKAYALFESFSRTNAAFGLFGNKPYTLDYPRNEVTDASPKPMVNKTDVANAFWKDYRWHKALIDYYRMLPSVTHWLATCQMNPDMNTAPDYWLVNKANISFNLYWDLSDVNLGKFCLCCADDIKIRGFSCLDTPGLCNPAFWNWQDLHIQVESSHVDCYTRSPNVQGDTPFGFLADSVASEDNFGIYWAPNPVHTCSATLETTTNYWMCESYQYAGGGGDPHFVSLDGLKFKYDGPCSYMLATNKCGKKSKDVKYPLFEVISHHGRCRSHVKNVVCIKKLTINIWKKASQLTKIELESLEDLSINGYTMTLPYNDEYLDIKIEDFEHKGETFQRANIKLDFGMDILWTDGAAGSFEVALSQEYHTCGLLGNNNGRKEDDLLLKDGTMIEFELNEHVEKDDDSVIRMGDSWLVPTPNQKLRCSLYPESSLASKKNCAFDQDSVNESCDKMLKTQLKKLKGTNVEKCFPKDAKFDTRIDQTRIYDDCITEVCACKKDLFKDCIPKVTIQEFKDACVNNGVVEFPKIEWKFQ